MVVDAFHEKFVPAVSPVYDLVFIGSSEVLKVLMYFIPISEVMHIKRQHVIGVGADGVGLFKHGRLCWLQVGKFCLFDLFNHFLLLLSICII